MRCVGLLVWALTGATLAGACGSPDGAGDGGVREVTWAIDCVAVLGTPPTAEQTPLEGIPYSGVARDKLISALSDDELGALCDFDDCLRVNGYRRNCYPHGDPRFKLETLFLVSGAVFTCYPSTDGTDGSHEVSWFSREDCLAIYRRYFGRCHVASWEDCIREGASAPLASHWTPSCAITNMECPVE